MSEDGRFVAFDSSASNLVARDGNRKVDVFVRDRQTGTTRRVSGTSSEAGANGPSFNPSISADGRIVGFDSGASNLVRRDRNDAWDVFVRDRQAGTTRRVSLSSAGVAGNRDSWSAVVSADGRHVAFASLAFNLVAGDSNRQADIFVRDRQTGTTTRVSVRSNGRQTNGGSAFPAISADGRFVAFRSVATNLVAGDTNGHADVFVHDRETGRTRRISVARDGSQANGPSDAPALSADGNVVAFESSATNLIPSDTNAYRDVFVRDRAAGRTRRVSLSTSYVAGNGLSERAALSGDGRVVAFTSYATNLVRRDTNRRADVFVRGPFAWAGAGSEP
jgi:Tol biopolymer transport system component